VRGHLEQLADERDREIPDWSASRVENVIAEVEVGAGYEEVQGAGLEVA